MCFTKAAKLSLINRKAHITSPIDYDWKHLFLYSEKNNLLFCEPLRAT